jgi:Holliday junction resolvase
MPAPREKTITNSIMKAARERGWWVLKLAAGPWQTPGLPDLLLIKDGVARFLEVKAAAGRVTPHQQAKMLEIERYAGARCDVVRSRDEALAAIER